LRSRSIVLPGFDFVKGPASLLHRFMQEAGFLSLTTRFVLRPASPKVGLSFLRLPNFRRFDDEEFVGQKRRGRHRERPGSASNCDLSFWLKPMACNGPFARASWTSGMLVSAELWYCRHRAAGVTV